MEIANEEIWNPPGDVSVVLREIFHVQMDGRVLIGEDKIRLAVRRPIGRLAGNAYARAVDIFETKRPRSGQSEEVV